MQLNNSQASMVNEHRRTPILPQLILLLQQKKVTCVFIIIILQVPGGNIGVNAQAAADGPAAQQPADAAPDGLAPVNPHEAGNQGDEAELDDEEGDDEEEEEDEEDDDDEEEGREEDAADGNNGGQGQCVHGGKKRCLIHLIVVFKLFT